MDKFASDVSTNSVPIRSRLTICSNWLVLCGQKKKKQKRTYFMLLNQIEFNNPSGFVFCCLCKRISMWTKRKSDMLQTDVGSFLSFFLFFLLLWESRFIYLYIYYAPQWRRPSVKPGVLFFLHPSRLRLLLLLLLLIFNLSAIWWRYTEGWTLFKTPLRSFLPLLYIKEQERKQQILTFLLLFFCLFVWSSCILLFPVWFARTTSCAFCYIYTGKGTDYKHLYAQI